VSSYPVRTTSRASADVEQDVVLSETATTRRILRGQIVHNLKDASQPLRVVVRHQRRRSQNEPWKDADSFSLVQVPAGHEIKFEFDAAQTMNLYLALRDLYALARAGVPTDDTTLTVVDRSTTFVAAGEEREALLELLGRWGDRFWTELRELRPEELDRVALARVQEQRREAVATFRTGLDEDWSEREWGRFFRANTWIFGFGLDYRFLTELQDQANVGGADLSGRGEQVPDYLMGSEGDLRFTVLVDIKKPTAPLLGKEYRNRAFPPGDELSGVVAQIQAACHRFAIEGSQTEAGREQLRALRAYPYEPEGIAVIGRLSQLGNDVNRIRSFAQFRRNLHNPRVLTFDELLQRAQYLVDAPVRPSIMPGEA
jgi:hypothetical protein